MFARSHLQLAERYLTAAAFWRYCTVSLQAPHSGNDLQGAALWILAVYRWGLGGAMFDPSQDHRWAVILAGGEGLRLRLLTRFVSGDDRPKQFCPFSGGRTLLSDTARRIGRLFSAERTVFSLVHSHELYYAKELENVPPERMFVQPADRGTLPAILYSLLRLIRGDKRAVAAFFPTDHHFFEEERFLAGMELAFAAAEAHSDTVILMGAPATYAATDYGWIEVEAASSRHFPTSFLRVKNSWEKPARQVAEELLDRGCIWNTFVMVGRAEAFPNRIRSAAPALCQAFASSENIGVEQETLIVRAIYEQIPPVDFSQSVLSSIPRTLGVFSLGDVGWSDLGDPQRLLEAMTQTGERSEWFDAWRQEAM